MASRCAHNFFEKLSQQAAARGKARTFENGMSPEQPSMDEWTLPCRRGP
jgi:hypothetical protein